MPSTYYKPLIVSISPPSLWRRYLAEHQLSGGNRYQKRLRVFARDEYQCVYCGYRSKSDLQIHHANRKHDDNRLINLETVCVMCHLIMHAGYAAEVLGILDFYAIAKYPQNDIVLLTRQFRAKGMSDRQITFALGLQDRRPFVSDPHYLAQLRGFISSRSPSDGRVNRALRTMYMNERKRKTLTVPLILA
jgi:hypothetical protein